MDSTADDFYIVKEIKRIFGLSNRPHEFWRRDHDRKRGINAGDAVRFYVRDTPTLLTRIIPTFERFPLRSKKQFEFVLFTEAIHLLNNYQKSFSRTYPPETRKRLSQIHLRLQEMEK